MGHSDKLLYWVELFFYKEWFHIGATAITLSRVLGFILIILIIHWLAKAVEKVIYTFAHSRAGAAVSGPSIYALSRISRYIILFVGSVAGLNFIGFDLNKNYIKIANKRLSKI